MDFPLLGLGTYKLTGKQCEKVVGQALEMGYRHIDTADVYENHNAIGRALQGVERGEIFLTSKLFIHQLTPGAILEAVPRFLEELQVEYLDLLLIHWPNPEVDLVAALQTMELLRKKGLTRRIGVSNFVRFNLEALDPYNLPIFTNQVELHPYFQRRELVKACLERGIKITAYRPLAQGAFAENRVLHNIGKSHGKTPSQVVLRWFLQKGICAIPKASSVEHLKENFSVFDFQLTEGEMGEIDHLDSGQRFCAPEGLPVYED